MSKVTTNDEDSALKCLTIMPFAQEFDDVYAMIRAAVDDSFEDEPIKCSRIDENPVPGSITDELLQALHESALIVADATGRNANVMWEIGYAMALRKPVIMITQDETLPFNIRNYRALTYNRSALGATLLGPLKTAVTATLKKFTIRRATLDPLTTSLSKLSPTPATIAVTGSMECDPTRAARRVEKVLSPYLGRSVRWLTGSYGTADEAAIRFLSNHKELLTVVGYHSYDISDGVRRLVEERAIPFVDARHEQLPKLPVQVPNERDALFLTKADLVVLVWDGESSGTREMIEWYEQTHRDHVVTFV